MQLMSKCFFFLFNRYDDLKFTLIGIVGACKGRGPAAQNSGRNY
jgi:hypothetical protein